MASLLYICGKFSIFPTSFLILFSSEVQASLSKSQTTESFLEGPDLFNRLTWTSILLPLAKFTLQGFMECFASQTSDTLHCPNELMEACRGQREHGNTTLVKEEGRSEEKRTSHSLKLTYMQL